MAQQFVDPYHYSPYAKFKLFIRVMVYIAGVPSLFYFTFVGTFASLYLTERPLYPVEIVMISLLWMGTVLVFFYMIKSYTRNKSNILNILKHVKLEGLFDPLASDELFGPHKVNYFGIDVQNGTIVYISHVNSKQSLFANDILVFGFDIHNWRSCELVGNKLTIHTNDPRIPFISVMHSKAPVIFEKLSAIRNMNFSYPHSFPGWVDFKAQQVAEARGLNLIPIKY